MRDDDEKLPHFAVLGSCVSRDPFHGPLAKLALVDSDRTAFATRACSPIEFELLDGYEDCGATPFEIKSVIEDFKKNTLNRCLDPKIDFILIDLLMEVTGDDVNLYQIGDSYIQKNVGYSQLKPFIRHADPVAEFGCESLIPIWNDNINKTVEFFKINNLYEKIIIHYCFNADRQILPDGTLAPFEDWLDAKARRANSILEYFYDSLFSLLPGARKIEIDSSLRISDPAHKFGLSASHFIQPYYDEFMRQVFALTAPGKSSNVNDY